MRLWLLCAVAVAVAVAVAGVAGAEHGASGMAARGREGRRRPHRPCSGCFSVLSEESQSMPWNSREEEAPQPGRRARSGKGLESPEGEPGAGPARRTPRAHPAAVRGDSGAPAGARARRGPPAAPAGPCSSHRAAETVAGAMPEPGNAAGHREQPHGSRELSSPHCAEPPALPTPKMLLGQPPPPCQGPK
uniref:basic salivary proline-rich protein 1-like isoform X1 n=1 Tax=Agelaius phoeniceus TaxID=39638 RepID=UPI0023EC8A02|nr:basic salivary proline-rich protein 1-like isoform X1 [Agelaius phoeniceus]